MPGVEKRRFEPERSPGERKFGDREGSEVRDSELSEDPEVREELLDDKRRRSPDYARGLGTKEGEAQVEETQPSFARGQEDDPDTNRRETTNRPDFARGQDSEEGDEEIENTRPDFSRGMHERKGETKNE